MSFPDADRPHEKQAALNHRVSASQRVRVPESDALVGVVLALHRIIILQRALAVAPRDARRFQQFRLILLRAAAATPRALAGHDFHPAAEAVLANGGLLRCQRALLCGGHLFRQGVAVRHGEEWMNFSVVRRHSARDATSLKLLMTFTARGVRRVAQFLYGSFDCPSLGEARRIIALQAQIARVLHARFEKHATSNDLRRPRGFKD